MEGERFETRIRPGPMKCSRSGVPNSAISGVTGTILSLENYELFVALKVLGLATRSDLPSWMVRSSGGEGEGEAMMGVLSFVFFLVGCPLAFWFFW